MSTYKRVPDQTAGRPKDKDERHLFQWLDAHCEFREQRKAEVAPIVEGYRAAFRHETGMDLPPRTILRMLVSLGHVVAEPHVVGLFMRSPDAVPEPETPVEQTLRGGISAPVDPGLFASNGLSMDLPPKPEVRFVESGPQPQPKLRQDPDGIWRLDKSK